MNTITSYTFKKNAVDYSKGRMKKSLFANCTKSVSVMTGTQMAYPTENLKVQAYTFVGIAG
ncbi:MAG: hypothetical protein ACI80S_000324 [Pseudohongiellaceae bacterium]|jgi:hypothetical protein